jgi:aminoglycoside phosphotransferase (APT) family kinase protein
VAAAEQLLRCAKAARRIVHGDPTEGNVLDRQRLWLIDWEYAQLADPLYDVAAVLAYYPVARPHVAELLAAAGRPAGERGERLDAATGVHAALGWLWHYARGEYSVISAGISGGEWAN